MEAPQPLLPERYRLIRVIASGGMGVVWEGWDHLLERTVAVKQLRTQPGLDDAEAEIAKSRAMREARITARLHHPNAVPVFDAVERDGQPCIVMQYVPSRPLSAVLRAEGSIAPREAARIGAQVAAALTVAHRLGIVHRDVKPGNILLDEDDRALISDFGISRATGDGTLTSTGLVHGTPSYLAPEVARGGESSPASDVFSLGSTLYAAVEGEPPFGADANSIAVLHRVAMGDFRPPRHAGALTGLLMQMLGPDAVSRPTMAEVARTLERLQNVAETEAATVPLPAESADVDAASGAAESGTTAAWSATDGSASAGVLPMPMVAGAAAAPVPSEPVTAGSASEPDDDSAPPREPTQQSSESVATTPTLIEPTASMSTRPSPTRPSPTVQAPTVQVPTMQVPVRDELVSGGPADPASPPRRRSWVPVVLVILVLALAVALVAGPLRGAILGSGPSRSAGPPDPDGTRVGSSSPAAPAASPRSVSASASADSPRPSASTPTAATSASSRPSATETASASTSAGVSGAPPAPDGPPTAAQLAAAVTDYYRVMPDDTDAGWARLTDAYRRTTARSRSYYDTFWGAIRAVGSSNVAASAPDRVVATITYRYRDGRVVVERTAYRLERHGGVLQIAESTVLSSSG